MSTITPTSGHKLARTNGPDSSRNTAHLSMAFTGTQKAQVLQALQNYGPMQFKKIAAILNLDEGVKASRRLSDLKNTPRFLRQAN
jgi:hypothetical protein